ncbi:MULTISPECIES: ABC transporter permease [Enterococcus]|uniref:Peptide ABC transporter permease n=3 Tax=Enterococcus TaxID=1350 RepID=R2SPP8_9ENTE|nr:MULTISPECIES: ABC transporter permease [Enterococcus]ALS36389.1 peptide ABC transporter permease [Enterococcus rotai]EOH97205.1 peptide ABC transporter permease [Enterococcus haemoperoxidus ATCC BAA-382]EOT60018.1 peptide ABC transporter permease [Enterococcus haemoperoxidus ATCC BAA-382]OJG56199.1 peptide ABC transporter permease [Enterococcus haemoperoxidus]OTN88973.1 ABC transporter permease [Enterococcus sp. 7E2_DIV0204]
MDKNKENAAVAVPETIPPMGFRMIAREFKKDKLAIFSLVLLVAILLVVFIGALLTDQDKVMTVSILDKYAEPGGNFILGADEGGRDVLGQLIIGARNSVVIGFAITILTSIIGVGIGIVSGYYGGMFDNAVMRVVDFIMILPIMMIIIVFVTIIPNYNVWSFVGIMSAFYWVAKARLFRSKTLSEVRRDYVSASKTLGTSDFKIMFREIMPNLSSLIITNLTINFAANIGIETTLTFLGFGLPTNVPSLGTLIGYASNGDVLANKTWIWVPASVLILVMMLCINYIGQAFKRSADARQRLG